MKTCAIVGINWGDEGKGRMVDLLTRDYDIVVRYQGGGNAGHTVINEYGKFALHLLPSGIFRPNVVNILGNGVAMDMKSLCGEMESVAAKGVSVTPDNLKISDRASLVLPWHILLDELEEERLKDKKYGSTKQGIAPFYSDKYQKKTIQAGELFYPEYLVRHLEDLLEWKNLTLTRVYGAKPYTMAQLCDYLHTYGQKLKPFICDTGSWLRKAQQDGKSILFEAQLGALRDLDYGIYPYTTSSNAVAAYAPVGSGLPSAKLDEVVGVVKAYSTCVGEGPFVCEWFGPEADRLREDQLPRESGALFCSALKGLGLEQLVDRICQVLGENLHTVDFVLPYAQAQLLDYLYRAANVRRADYVETGIHVEAVVDEKVFGRLQEVLPPEQRRKHEEF